MSSLNAMVAVCDVLGFSNLVKSSSLLELKDFHMENIKNIMKSSIPHFSGNLRSSPSENAFYNGMVGHAIFSDTILIYSLYDDYHGYRNVLDAVDRLISIPMFHPKHKYRVGVSYGEFYSDQKENMYIGKALVEAHELEKKQQWSGAALTRSARSKFNENGSEMSQLVDYDIPVKHSSGTTHEKYSVVNWTRANHQLIGRKQNWMYREENNTQVVSYTDKNVEQKILNTEKFHSDICVQCKCVKNITI